MHMKMFNDLVNHQDLDFQILASALLAQSALPCLQISTSVLDLPHFWYTKTSPAFLLKNNGTFHQVT